MKRKRTFFNSRNERLYWDYEDTNNLLFTIMYYEGKKFKEKNFILRNLKKDNSVVNNIYKKLNKKFNIIEIDTSILSYSEYNLLKNLETPSIINCVKTEQLSGKKLQETQRGVRQNHELQEV